MTSRRVSHHSHQQSKPDIRKAATMTAAGIAAFATLTAPNIAMANESGTQESQSNSSTQLITKEQAMQNLQAVAQVAPSDERIAEAKSQADSDAKAQAEAQDAADQAQENKDTAQKEVNQAQQDKASTAQGLQDAQAGVDAAKTSQDAAQADKDAAQQAYDEATEKAGTADQIAQAQTKANEAQGNVNDQQAEAGKATAVEKQVESDKATADQAVTDAQSQANKAAADKKLQEDIKAEADKKVAEAQQKYDEAKVQGDAAKEQAAQELADAKTAQVTAQADYATKEQAVQAGQKSIDEAKAALDEAKAGSGVDVDAMNKGVGGFFESLINDPTLNDAQKQQAQLAYDVLVNNSLNVPWYDSEVSGWLNKGEYGEDSAPSIAGLKNGLTYIDAVNGLRTANNLNTLDINLYAMAIAILNSQHGGHSEIGADAENWAGLITHAYNGTADPDEWESAYAAGQLYGKDWPFIGWYTQEKHIFEEMLKEHPGMDGMDAFQIFQTYPDVYKKAGHYLNFIMPSLKSMGFGIGEDGAVWDGSTSATGTLTQEQFRNLVNAYVAMVEGAPDPATVAQARKVYDDAVANQTQLQAEADAAQKALDDAQSKLDAAQKKYDAANDQTTIEKLKQELDDAKANADTAAQNVKSADDAVADAAQKLQAAQQAQVDAAAKLVLAQDASKEANATLDRLQKELKSAQDELAAIPVADPVLKAKLDDAVSKLAAAQDAYARALAALDAAQNADTSAAEKLQAKLAALQDANAKFADAEAALATASAAATHSKAVYDALIRLKIEIDAANQPEKTADGGNDGPASENTASVDKAEAPVSVQAASKAAKKVELATTGAAVDGIVMVMVSLTALGLGTSLLKKRPK